MLRSTLCVVPLGLGEAHRESCALSRFLGLSAKNLLFSCFLCVFVSLGGDHNLRFLSN